VFDGPEALGCRVGAEISVYIIRHSTGLLIQTQTVVRARLKQKRIAEEVVDFFRLKRQPGKLARF